MTKPLTQDMHDEARSPSEYGHMPTCGRVKPLARADFAALFRGTAARLGIAAEEADLALRQMELE